MNALMYVAVVLVLCSLPPRVDAQSTPSSGYQDSLQQYNEGKRDSAFVQALARRAREVQDTATAARMALDARLALSRERGAWQEYARLQDLHIKRYPPQAGGGDAWRMNHIAWDAFLACTDTTVLVRALAWSELSLELQPKHVEYLDTKANLLHKLGRTTEAIAWQEKAVAQEITNQGGKAEGALFDVISDALAKMKRGEPTWPTQ